ncbi:hypothetical protein ACHAXS_000197 [Conticribra weissflogii]
MGLLVSIPKVQIELLPGLEPVHHCAYQLPYAYEQTFKKELQHIIDTGILEECSASEWIFPCFIIAKKDGRVRQISGLCSLNKYIKHNQYPLPIIHDIMQPILGCKSFTKLDISMKYHLVELDEEPQEFCEILTPYGKYKYRCLPMGLK